MKHSEIKQVKEQLRSQKVPIASIHYVQEGEPTPIRNSTEMSEMLRANWEADTLEAHESFYLVLLNRANKVQGILQHSKGGLTGTIVDQRLILASSLLALSCSIILAHNHPSGNIQPSEADLKITKKIKESAELMEIKVLDHIILTKESYFSFADEGVL